MAVKITNGSIVHIASGKAAAKNVTAATNAAEAVLTVAAHGLTAGDYVVVTSGWGSLNGRVFRVKAADTGTVTLEGADTTNTDKYPAGGGVGKIEKIKCVSCWVMAVSTTSKPFSLICRAVNLGT